VTVVRLAHLAKLIDVIAKVAAFRIGQAVVIENVL